MIKFLSELVTENKLRDLTGYSRSQVKMRRHRHWVEGQHFAKEPAGVYVYSLKEIENWQKTNLRALEKNAEKSKFIGGMRVRNTTETSISHTPLLT